MDKNIKFVFSKSFNVFNKTKCLIILIILLNYFCKLTTAQYSRQLYEGSECDLYDGTVGTCKIADKCKWFLDKINRRAIHFNQITRCGFEGNEEIICCGDERPASTIPRTSPLSPTFDDDGIYFDENTAEHIRLTKLLNSTAPNVTVTFHPTLLALNTSKLNPTFNFLNSSPNLKSSTTTWPSIQENTIPRQGRQENEWSTESTPSFFPTIPAKKIVFPTVTSTERSKQIQFPTLSTTNVQTTKKTTPSVNSFWSEWAPTNPIPENITSTTHFIDSSSNEIEDIDVYMAAPESSPKSSKLAIDSWLQDVLVKISTTTPQPNAQIPQNQVLLINPTVQNPIQSNSSISQTNSKLTLAPWLQDVINQIPTSSTTARTVVGLQIQDDRNVLVDNNALDLNGGSQSSTSTSVTQPPNRLGLRRCDIACANYTTLSSPFLSFNILGGVATSLGEFPHMAALGYASEEIGDTDYNFSCGGSIISENFILTAAHCVTGRNVPVVVRMGKITLHTNDDGAVGLTSNIAEIIIHPNYHTNRRYDDIALIRLSVPLAFTATIRPACLRTNLSDIDPSIPLIVTGWGRTSVERAQVSAALLKTNLTAVSLQTCNSSILEYNSNDRTLRNGINLGQICAYDPQARRDACEGDSGGPLQINHANGMSTIVGITSFGISCGSLLPSVYCRVAYYIDWIESIVWANR